jgi:hypothetical protein
MYAHVDHVAVAGTSSQYGGGEFPGDDISRQTATALLELSDKLNRQHLTADAIDRGLHGMQKQPALHTAAIAPSSSFVAAVSAKSRTNDGPKR